VATLPGQVPGYEAAGRSEKSLRRILTDLDFAPRFERGVINFRGVVWDPGQHPSSAHHFEPRAFIQTQWSQQNDARSILFVAARELCIAMTEGRKVVCLVQVFLVARCELVFCSSDQHKCCLRLQAHPSQRRAKTMTKPRPICLQFNDHNANLDRLTAWIASHPVQPTATNRSHSHRG